MKPQVNSEYLLFISHPILLLGYENLPSCC